MMPRSSGQMISRTLVLTMHLGALCVSRTPPLLGNSLQRCNGSMLHFNNRWMRLSPKILLISGLAPSKTKWRLGGKLPTSLPVFPTAPDPVSSPPLRASTARGTGPALSPLSLCPEALNIASATNPLAISVPLMRLISLSRRLTGRHMLAPWRGWPIYARSSS